MKKPYLFAGVSILFWSTLAVTAKLLLESVNNIQLLCLSSLFAGLVLLVMNIVTGKIKILKNFCLKDYFVIALRGLPGIFLYHIFYYAGAERLPASQAFIINYMWPIMSVVFACIILKEKMTLRTGVAIALSFIGVAIVTGAELLHFNKNMLAGATLCLLGAISYGLFTTLNQKKNYDKCISMMINFFVAFILTGVIIVVKGDWFVPNHVQLLGIVWSGVFTMAIPNTTWILALEGGSTSKISNLAYITPFLSLVWTSLILKEELNFYSIIGLWVIIIGIFIQIKDKQKPRI